MATSTIDIRLADVEDLRTDGGVLLVDYHCEVERDHAIDRLVPDWFHLQRMENAERCVCLMAYHDDDAVGFCLSLLEPHTHNRDQWQLINDSIYVDPVYRRRGLGLQLVRLCESAAEKLNADCVWRAPAFSRLDLILSAREGYRATHTVYARTS